ncbi:ATP-binding cassette domain-containing protein [Streptomyces sp. TRM66268-LWL]|uniref:ATP-binding cassette domain-containing protein n=1 Tax=Streptomyces polyasparticus TaxID=2767826 RepID=A0ABR7SLQ7_9ACTN|nr:ATP-binding cassette domain-containing protein [Streptomyces polyasparticus]MBC9715298.1 ATP-binding cassette domain-containing protein [Streptomyces polyasparticus]
MSTEIELRRARVRYGPLEALHGVDLVAAHPGVTVLLGRNGSGRTTALRALAGTVRPSEGRVLWRGRDITRVPAHERAARGIRFVPDRQAVFASMSVEANLELAAPQGELSPAFDAYPELKPLLGRRAATLSGGEQRMLAVAGALLSRPRVLLLDEPAQGMSPAVTARTYELLASLETTVVTAEQRLPPALRAPAGRTVLVHELRRGAVVFSGEAAEWAAAQHI